MFQLKKTFIDKVKILIILIKLTRPEWGFIFAAVAGMVGLLYQLPWESIFVGWLSIYLFIAGHFCLNGYFDRKSDAINKRGLTLRNPLTQSTLISKEIIFLWVAFIWSLPIPLNIFIIPNSLTFPKLALAFLAYGIAITGSTIYSVPPFRFKSRPFLDLGVTFFSIGFFVPFYVGLLGPETLVSIDLLLLGILLNLILIAGVHLPTMLIDLEIDKQAGDKTTAVYLGKEKTIYATSIVIVARVAGLVLLNLYLMMEGILIISWLPFILGAIELLAVYNLLHRQTWESSLLLLKIIIITSSGGGVIFGLLYSPTLISAYLT
ncbi:MAG: UbiA family prenyltransferase [Candidatus Heimdallarchaeota archaeon]|nr:UbiA family prenyltransferase [Candidatus Heimdallarchaeota archaeon]